MSFTDLYVVERLKPALLHGCIQRSRTLLLYSKSSETGAGAEMPIYSS